MGLFNRDTRSLDEIKRDNIRLHNERALRDDMNRYEEERRKASRENFNLKHYGKIRMVKKVGKSTSWIGKGLVTGLNAVGEQYIKAQDNKRPRKKKTRRVKKVRR